MFNLIAVGELTEMVATFYSENCTLEEAVQYAQDYNFKYVRSYACCGWVRWTLSNSYQGVGAIEWTNAKAVIV